MTDLQEAEFTVGGVLGRSFKVYSHNFLTFVALAWVIHIPVYVGAYFIDYSYLVSGDWLTILVTTFGLLFGQLLFTFFLMSILVYGTVADLRGYSIGFGEWLARGLEVLLPVLILAAIILFLYIIGTMLLVIPGLLAVVFFWVVIPVAVVERPGLMACFSRSIELTRGNRWKVLGLSLIVLALVSAVSSLASAVAGLFGYSGLEAEGEVLIGEGCTAYLVIDWLANGLITAFWSVVVSVSYHDLRVQQEGMDDEEIVAVFD